MTAYDLNKVRILVIDDSRYMIKIIRTLLETMGVHVVRGISRGEEVFKEIRTFEPDLIITDQVLENEEGLDIIRSIRDSENAHCRYIPIILLTGHAHQSVVTKARFNAGADAVLAKPVSAQRLFSCIVSLYESNRTFVSTGTYFGPDRRVRDRPFEGLGKRGEDRPTPKPQLTEVKAEPQPAASDFNDDDMELDFVAPDQINAEQADEPAPRRQEQRR